MKLIVKTDILKNITSTLTKVAAKEQLGTVLSGVYIEAKNNKAIFKTKQIDFEVRYTTDAEKTEDGEMYVPIQAFDGVISSLIDTTATIELTGKKLTITTTTSTSEIYTLDMGEKPEFKEPEGTSSFSVRREILIQGFKKRTACSCRKCGETGDCQCIHVHKK